MPFCKYCNAEFDWGWFGNRFVPLIPVNLEGNHARTYVDENGVLRSAHNLVCTERGNGSGGAIQLTKLATPVIPGRSERAADDYE